MINLCKIPFSKVKCIHFTGIGGIGMSGIASLFKKIGFDVQGSDIKPNQNTERLEQLGIKIFDSQQANNIQNADVVVISSAIKKDNVEYIEAQKQGIPILRRSRMLAELMRSKWGIAVSGTHGKTTITSLISHILSYTGKDPTAVIGGIVNEWKDNSRYGSSNWMVAESDESDGFFLDLPATIAVVSNIESEHMEFYKSHENLLNYFKSFVNKIPFYGFVVVCADDKGVQSILPFIKENNRVITYGTSKHVDYRITNIRFDKKITTLDIHSNYANKNEVITNVEVPMHGKHNVLNVVASIVVAKNIGLKDQEIKKSLKCFSGVKRRFTNIGEQDGVSFIDDYAHHPTEIKAALETANTLLVEGKKIVAILQPHKYSRLKTHFKEFSLSFNTVDYVIVLDVYPAGETPIKGFSGLDLAQNMSRYGHKGVIYIKSTNEIIDTIKKFNSNNEIALAVFLGAGSISSIAHQVYNNYKTS